MWIIGDVHGNFEQYKEIVERADDLGQSTIQIGDMGFNYDFPWSLNHRFFGGNHDNYDKYYDSFHGMCDFGPVFLDDKYGFFIRGALSIDQHVRTIGIDWWEQEQLSIYELEKCCREYLEAKPKIVLSHDCPLFLYDNWYKDKLVSRTAQALECMFQMHKPELWIFGHHHRSWNKTIDGCEFRCINELEVVEI